MAQPMYLCSDGLEKLKAELEYLRTVRRPEVAESIHQSRERGGAVGDGEYEDARNELAFTEGRIQTLDNIINHAIIIEEGPTVGDTVQIGSRVKVKDQSGKTFTYTIAGSAEADPAQRKISNVSPIGEALLGKRVGEITEVTVPAGQVKLEILSFK